jgi:DivIVA domain-containing protein
MTVDGHEWADGRRRPQRVVLEPPLGKRGYDEKSVNDFLQLAVRRLEGRGQLSADDVRGVRFRKPPIFQRGYDQDEVDALFNDIAAAIAALDGRG